VPDRLLRVIGRGFVAGAIFRGECGQGNRATDAAVRAAKGGDAQAICEQLREALAIG
jgi:hypothetical protein